MIENFTNVGMRISKQMDVLDFKQIDICRITGISKNAMSNYVNGNRVPDTMAVYKLSKVLEVSIEWLLVGEETEEVISDTETLQLTDIEKDIVKKLQVLDYDDKREVSLIVDMKHEKYIKKETSLTSSNGEKGEGAGKNETA